MEVTVLNEVVANLRSRGFEASVEFPGYIACVLEKYNVIVFGGNEDWSGEFYPNREAQEEGEPPFALFKFETQSTDPGVIGGMVELLSERWTSLINRLVEPVVKSEGPASSYAFSIPEDESVVQPGDGITFRFTK